MSEWHELADLNLIAVIKSRMQAIPNASFAERDGIASFSIGRPYLDGHLNGIFSCATNAAPQRILELGDHFTKSHGFDFIYWIRDHADRDLEMALRGRGLLPKREPGSAGMIIDHSIILPKLSIDYSVSRVSTQNDVDDFARVVATSFSYPVEIAKLAIGPQAQLTKQNVHAFLVRSNGAAVAGGMVIVEHDVAGLYYIATVPEARGRGLGELCTALACNAGIELSARAVILQASLLGERLYQRLGFRTITHYRWYGRAQLPV